MVVVDVKQFVGTVGEVTDTDFEVLTEYLRLTGKVVSEEEKTHLLIGSVSTIYEIPNQGFFKLEYQVRTPNTPESTYFMFHFDEYQPSHRESRQFIE